MMPKRFDSTRGTRMPATVTPAPDCDVRLDHLPRVHAVDVVGAEHTDVFGRSSSIRFRFWKMASAEPSNQRVPSRICAGTLIT